MLGHKVSSAGLEFDKAKIDVITRLPPPTNVKAVRSFLGHAGFYRHFIKYFSKISRPMTKLLEKDVVFDFNKECIEAFELLIEKLTNAPILVSPDWSQPFELMYDASDFAVGAVLGQREGKHFRPIYFASKTLNNAQKNYTITEKELHAVVFAFDKFRSGKFHLFYDFLILEDGKDSKGSTYFGRLFLPTAAPGIRVKQKQLNLGVGTERMIFNIDSTMKHSYLNDDTCFSIDVINEILEEDFDALLNKGSKTLYPIEGTLLEEESLY
ncbi:reverse transcriptase domain-containing protein [Tanacetum coccineum]